MVREKYKRYIRPVDSKSVSLPTAR